jgi:hypothetical protein
MNTKSLSRFIFLVTWVVAACATEGGKIDRSVTPRAAVAQVAAEQMAEFNRRQLLQAAYIRDLSSAVSQEARHEVRASHMEMKIRKAAADHHLAGTLKTVICKTSKCEVQLEVSPPQSPQAAIEHQRAFDHWIMIQPCSYTQIGAPLTGNGPEVIRIFLNCRE